MSLRKRQADVHSLSFDPFVTEPQGGFKRRFEWAVDHESQEVPDWCWAACLSNALTCVGVYMNQDEIVERFRNDHDGPENATFQGIPSPQHMVELWHSYGFKRALFVDERLGIDRLAEEIVSNGPVQIELWREDSAGTSHLALVFGLRETSEAVEVGVSDPLRKKVLWLPYGVLAGPAPLAAKFGEWRRTYVGLGYESGYLRRFCGRPSQFLAGLPDENTGNGATIPEVPAVDSHLEFDLPPYPYPPLPNELSIALYGYRHYRYLRKKATQEELLLPLFLFESIPIWRPPYEIDYQAPLPGQLHLYRWHHQIHDADGPRYYAEAWFFEKLREQFDRAWRTAWVGERWKARRVDDAIRKLDADFKDRQEAVWMVEFRRHGLVTLLLPESGIHVVVSVQEERQETFPLLATFSDEDLRAAVAGLSSATTAQLLD